MCDLSDDMEVASALIDGLERDAMRYRKLRSFAIDGRHDLEARVAMAQLDFTGSNDRFDEAVDAL